MFKNSDLCIANEYNFKDKDIDLSTAEIKGRYPETGYCVNTKVKEMIYVLKGKGKISTEHQVISFKKGDAILINKNEKYFWDANCNVLMTCTPSWYPEQHLLIK